MLPVVAHQILQGEPEIRSDVVDDGCLFRVVQHMLRHSAEHILISLEILPHVIHKGTAGYAHVHHTGCAPAVYHVFIDIIEDQLGVRHIGIIHYALYRKLCSQKLESVHAVHHDPVPQHILYEMKTVLRQEIELHDYLHPVDVQLLHEIHELLCGICRSIGRFRHEVVTGHISP